MRIIHYCQHIWGVGHFFRSIEVCRALKNHDVIMVTGGPEFNAVLPDHVRLFRLPGLMTDRNYDGLFPTDNNKTFQQVKQARQELLYGLIEREAPDILIIELYPFGRKAFRFELDPVLKGIRNGHLNPCKVVCSLRDILVEKKDPVAYETRVVDILNRYFHALLIHADSNLVKLDHTFSRIADLNMPVVYTGFVSQKPPPDAREKIRRRLDLGDNEALIIASAGGGKAGIVLLQPLLESMSLLNLDRKCHLYAFTGPFMPDEEFELLKKFTNTQIQIERFSSNFLSYLAAADLSVSMGGYNTSMNLLATGVPAIIWPYPGDREQGLRAESLAGIGAATVLKEKDLQPHRMVKIIDHSLCHSGKGSYQVDLQGAENTAGWIQRQG